MRHAIIPIHLIQDARAAAAPARQLEDAPPDPQPATDPQSATDRQPATGREPGRLATLFRRARARTRPRARTTGLGAGSPGGGA